jgi:hypothetical protein
MDDYRGKFCLLHSQACCGWVNMDRGAAAYVMNVYGVGKLCMEDVVGAL